MSRTLPTRPPPTLLAGNDLGNTITGGTGNDALDGGVGADVLVGGAGTIILHRRTRLRRDRLRLGEREAGEGIDTLNTWGHYTLAANLENLVLLGSADLQGRGNDIANTLTGNSGINLLDGGAGADLIQGGAGGDTDLVDNAGDVVAESASEGFDAVFSTVDRALEANVETLVLQGSADLQGDGNSLPNTLYGNAGNNLLDGNGGATRWWAAQATTPTSSTMPTMRCSRRRRRQRHGLCGRALLAVGQRGDPCAAGRRRPAGLRQRRREHPPR